MVDFKYIIRRLTFSFELDGFFSKKKYFIQELLNLASDYQPKGIQRVVWNGPKGKLVLNFYDSLGCFRAEIVDLKMLDIELKNKKDPTIVDIGSNQGFSVLWFKYNYPGAKIHAYEPVKKSFNILEKNVLDNNLKDCVLNNSGVSDKDKTAIIFHHSGGAGLGDNLFINSGGDEEEQIKLVNLDSKFDSIDLLKLDAEGSEYSILKNCVFWKKADKIIIEFHDHLKPDNVDYKSLIKNAGFKLDKKVGEGTVYVYYFSKRDINE